MAAHRTNLLAGEKSAFWMLAFVIGFIEVMAFFASSYIGHGRWQVNVLQSVLYIVGIACRLILYFREIKKEKNDDQSKEFG